ncbi:MAG: hypothetical protein RBU37_25645, partial [Myxococcota bacterium]|nr:hypothetical protein [Myxococcota bacterium]
SLLLLVQLFWPSAEPRLALALAVLGPAYLGWRHLYLGSIASKPARKRPPPLSRHLGRFRRALSQVQELRALLDLPPARLARELRQRSLVASACFVEDYARWRFGPHAPDGNALHALQQKVAAARLEIAEWKKQQTRTPARS